MYTAAPAAKSASILDTMSNVSELQNFGSLPMCIAMDKSGSTYGATLASELEAVGQLCDMRQDSSTVPVKILPWCDKASPPVELSDILDDKGRIGSGGGTDPSSLYASDSCLTTLRSTGLWVLMTDGEIYDSLVEKFAAQTTEVGMHNKPCVIIVFGDVSLGRPAACNISVGIAIYAIVPDCVFLFHDIPSGTVRVMQAKGKFKGLLHLGRDGQPVKLQVSKYTSWAELPRVAYKDLFDVELPTLRNLDPDEMAFQDGLIINIPDMLAGKIDEGTIESMLHNSDNIRSIALASKTRGTGKHIASWLKAQQKDVSSKNSLPVDVNKRANRAIIKLLEALRIGEQEPKLGDLRRAVRDAHAQNMIDFWDKDTGGFESDVDIRQRNLRLRNAARVASSTDAAPATTGLSVSKESPWETSAAYTSPFGFAFPMMGLAPTASSIHEEPGYAASIPPQALFDGMTTEVEPANHTSPSVTFPYLTTPFASQPLPEASEFTVGTCGYASGASDREERFLRATQTREPEMATIPFLHNPKIPVSLGDKKHDDNNNDNNTQSADLAHSAPKRKKNDTNRSTGIASRIIRRKRERRGLKSPSPSVCEDRRDPILVPNFKRRGAESEFRGRCMLCHNDDAVLALLLKTAPSVLTEGFPREGSKTKIAFPLAMGSFAEMKTVSSFVSCDACAFHLLRIGSCPTLETIIAALCLVSLPGNQAAILEAMDLTLRGRFNKDDLTALCFAMLDGKIIDNERNEDMLVDDKELFRKCAEWALVNLVDIIEVPASLSLAFANSSIEAPVKVTLNRLLGAEEFRDSSRLDNTGLLLLRYPIPGFLLLLRLLLLLDLASPEQAQTLMFHKLVFLIIDHYVERRPTSMSELRTEELLGTNGGSFKTSISLAELEDHSLLDSVSRRSLETGPDFEAFKCRSGPALAVFLHRFLNWGTGYSTSVICFNTLKAEPALRNIFLAPLAISIGLAADMISSL